MCKWQGSLDIMESEDNNNNNKFICTQHNTILINKINRKKDVIENKTIQLNSRLDCKINSTPL